MVEYRADDGRTTTVDDGRTTTINDGRTTVVEPRRGMGGVLGMILLLAVVVIGILFATGFFSA